METLKHSGLILAVALGLPLSGCSTDDIVRVNIPDVIPPGNLASADGATALRNGAIGDFAFAIDGDGGGTEGQTLVSGLMTDEYGNSDTFGTRQEIDQRAIELANVTLTGVFRNLHRARLSAERAAVALVVTAKGPDPRIAETLNLAAYTYVIAGENYCSGVPFPPDGQTDAPPLPTTQIYQEAIARFDSALANTGGSTTQEYTARVGEARALVDLGQFAAATALVAPVPTSFTYQIEHSINTGREQNGVYVFNALSKRWSVSDREGVTGLPFVSATDPRVPTLASGKGFDAVTPLVILLKYTDYSTPTNLADGVEARLIEAEAALNQNPPDVTTWLNTLNALRATVAGLAPLADPGTQAARVDQMFSERAFWLFATGHRLGDMRRLIRQYGRNSEAVFPTGAFFKGGVYGTDVNLPVPTDEQNNHSFKGCLNRDA